MATAENGSPAIGDEDNKELCDSEKEIHLIKRNKELEDEVKSFGTKRAYFMDMYKRKEEEALKMAEDLRHKEMHISRVEKEMKLIRDQVADIKTENMITRMSQDEEIERLKLMHQEELSSLNISMQEILNENSDRSEMIRVYERKLIALKASKKDVEDELALVRSSLQGRIEKEQEKIALSYSNQSTTGSPSSTAQCSCNSAACNEERQSLRMQIDDAHKKLQRYADVEIAETSKSKHKDLFEVVEQDERIRALENELKLEKDARRDLEMYVAVLGKQKMVFQDDLDNVRKELSDSLHLLDMERKEHNNLKTTWQMANDQFLESQRLLIIDMKRLESVLTEEQQRRVSELQKEDAEREAQQQKVDELERQKQEQLRKNEEEADNLLNIGAALQPSSSRTSLNSIDAYRDFDNAEPVRIGGTTTTSLQSALDQSTMSVDSIHIGQETTTPAVTLPTVLTEAMENSLLAPQPEDMENTKFLDSFRASTPDQYSSAAGKRLVSDKEWDRLQMELKNSRTKLGRPCESCQNYEALIQKEQDKILSLENQLSQSRQNVKTQKKTIDDLENNLSVLAQSCTEQLQQMSDQVEKTDELVFGLKREFHSMSQEFQERLLSLTNERENTQKELMSLEQENQQLMDLHSKTAQEMMDENLTIPSDASDLQLLLLEFRENLITVKSAKEHIEQKLRAELMLTKDQIIAVKLQWKNTEDSLRNEITLLQEQNVRLQSMESEMQRETTVRKELEIEKCELQKKLSSQDFTEEKLKSQVQQLGTDCNELKEKLNRSTDQVVNLQKDLTNSESVQKDFVKLSQQLQIQLEKIRQAEHEVRWQHLDDITQCSNCQKNLISNRMKHNCMHCGKIYCQECSSKVVNAGPSRRLVRVCDVCHTILVNEAAPYFSDSQ